MLKASPPVATVPSPAAHPIARGAEPTGARGTAAPENRFRTAARGSGMSQRELARRMRLEETKLSKAMSGTRRFQPEELFAFATLTGVTVNWLMGGADNLPDRATGGRPAPTARPVPTVLPRHEPGTSAEHGLKRRRIVQAAWRMFARDGFDRVRMADVAAAAEVSPPAIHYYFADKAELYTECMRFSVKLAYDRQLAQLVPLKSYEHRLRALARLQLPDTAFMRHEWSIWMQAWARSPYDGESRALHARSYRRWETTVRYLVSGGLERGEFRAQPFEPAVLRFTALFDGLGIRVLTGLLDPVAMLSAVDEHIETELLAGAGTSARARRRTP